MFCLDALCQKRLRERSHGEDVTCIRKGDGGCSGVDRRMAQRGLTLEGANLDRSISCRLTAELRTQSQAEKWGEGHRPPG